MSQLALQITATDRKNFNKALPDVVEKAQERNERLSAVKDEKLRQKVQNDFNDKMTKILKANNLTVDKFNALARQQQQQSSGG